MMDLDFSAGLLFHTKLCYNTHTSWYYRKETQRKQGIEVNIKKTMENLQAGRRLQDFLAYLVLVQQVCGQAEFRPDPFPADLYHVPQWVIEPGWLIRELYSAE